MKNALMTLVLLIGLTLGPYALADTSGHALGTCLADNLNGKERKNLAKWIFLSMAAHPTLKPYLTLRSKDKEEIDRYVGKLITRLFTVDCPKQLRMANSADPLAIQKAFKLVGVAAMQELMRNADVQRSMSNYAKYLDRKKIDALLGQK